MRKYSAVLLISSIVVILDQVSKWLVSIKIPLYTKVYLLPILDFTNVRNTGVAFGMLRDMPDHFRYPFYVVVLIIAIITVGIFLKKLNEDERIVKYSLALILGGAIGNSIDRFRLGYVTDFINFHWFENPNLNWPPFNISDTAITIGAIMILIFGIIINKRES
ncbi:MAG: signal peptidase II [Candidatus Dadabacteria bacterium]|nr:signal peptidase II [Candidatus Dadabacteria bacterium]NIQ13427.1 signal peptidase II [Candidatus Dadabacteria bacterium]